MIFLLQQQRFGLLPQMMLHFVTHSQPDKIKLLENPRNMRTPPGELSESMLLLADHYSDIILSAMVYQITSLTIVYSTIYSGTNQSSVSLAFVQGIHRWSLNSLHKGPVTQRRLLFDDVIMTSSWSTWVLQRSSDAIQPVWHQAITWTNADLLSIEIWGIKLSEIQN